MLFLVLLLSFNLTSSSSSSSTALKCRNVLLTLKLIADNIDPFPLFMNLLWNILSHHLSRPVVTSDLYALNYWLRVMLITEEILRCFSCLVVVNQSASAERCKYRSSSIAAVSGLVMNLHTRRLPHFHFLTQRRLI